jgi:AcrR family transcriptional regulator
MSETGSGLGRRQRRRLETIEEVIDIAAQIMAEQGVAGLSVGEVARRIGIRPPSLYVYFPSKNALYDALFARGAGLVLAAMEQSANALLAGDLPLEELLLGVANTLVGWSLDHPAYSQLLFWRPVPGYAPSPQAYAPALRLLELSAGWMAELQRRGLLRADVPAETVQRDWTIVVSGVISQQLANAPHEPAGAGRFTSALPGLVAMFAHYYGTSGPRSPDRPAHQPKTGVTA